MTLRDIIYRPARSAEVARFRMGLKNGVAPDDRVNRITTALKSLTHWVEVKCKQYL
ncbi:hypothetical protein LMG33818_000006 [Halomonadaceae bacterium LMG 33818]